MSKNVPIKVQKPQLYYCPDGLLVKLSAFHAEHYSKQRCDARLKLGQNIKCHETL